MNKLLLVGALSVLSFGAMSECTVKEGMYFDHSYKMIVKDSVRTHAGGFIDIQKRDGKIVMVQFYGENSLKTPKDKNYRVYNVEESTEQVFRTFDASIMKDKDIVTVSNSICKRDTIIIENLTGFRREKQTITFPSTGKVWDGTYADDKEVHSIIEYYHDLREGEEKKQIGIRKRIKVGKRMAERLRRAFLD